MIPVLVFLASGAIVVVAGSALARHADVIAQRTRLGRIWVGLVLLAGATSLPELVTDVTAVRLDATDLAVGDLLGSCMANMLILSVIDLVPQRGRVLRAVAFDHALAAALAICLNALAAALILVRSDTSVLGVSPGSLLLFTAYLVGARWLYRHATREGLTPAPPPLPAPEAPAAPPTLRGALIRFGVAAAVVVAAAPAFAWSARELAEISGLGQTFVGTWIVGLSTSLPELVASIAAVRLGAFDLAVGNLFGSNALNVAIFLPIDLAQPGSLFAVIDPNHALSALFAIVLMGLGLAAIIYRAKQRVAVVEPDSLLMLLVYVFALWLLYIHAAGPG